VVGKAKGGREVWRAEEERREGWRRGQEDRER